MKSEGTVLFNGAPAEGIPADNRGLAFGDGLFETLLLRRGEPVWLDEHLRRMERGCDVLKLAMPRIELSADIQRACDTVSDCDRAVLKCLVIRRSEGRRGYRPRSAQCDRLVSAAALPAFDESAWRNGVSVRLCNHRLPRNRALAGIKHLNRLDQVLATGEWHGDEFAEGLMCDEEGHVIEGTMSNLFLVADGKLVTPALDDCGVEGIVREKIIAYWRESRGEKPAVRAVTTEELCAADEIFLTNSLIGFWPVVSLEGQRKAIGPVIGEIQQAFGDVWHG